MMIDFANQKWKQRLFESTKERSRPLVEPQHNAQDVIAFAKAVNDIVGENIITRKKDRFFVNETPLVMDGNRIKYRGEYYTLDSDGLESFVEGV